MEFRLLGNENPVGNRRWFEDRVNLHLRFGWAPQGSLVAQSVRAQDWQKGLGPERPEESLFLFQPLLHPRTDPLAQLKELSAELLALEARPEAEREPAAQRRLKDLAAYLLAELEYHPELFAVKEAQEADVPLQVSKERLKRHPQHDGA